MKKTVLWANERSIGGDDVSASKDKERGTWKIYLRYVDWQGMKTDSHKAWIRYKERGFGV